MLRKRDNDVELTQVEIAELGDFDVAASIGDWLVESEKLECSKNRSTSADIPGSKKACLSPKKTEEVVNPLNSVDQTTLVTNQPDFIAAAAAAVAAGTIEPSFAAAAASIAPNFAMTSTLSSSSTQVTAASLAASSATSLVSSLAFSGTFFSSNDSTTSAAGAARSRAKKRSKDCRPVSTVKCGNTEDQFEATITPTGITFQMKTHQLPLMNHVAKVNAWLGEAGLLSTLEMDLYDIRENNEITNAGKMKYPNTAGQTQYKQHFSNIMINESSQNFTLFVPTGSYLTPEECKNYKILLERTKIKNMKMNTVTNLAMDVVARPSVTR